MQQARTRAVGEDGIFARAYPEHLLDELDALPDCAGIRERTVVAMLVVKRSAMKTEPRIRVPGHYEVRIRLVIPEEDVVARAERLDEVVLEEQRLAFRARDRRLHARDVRNHDLRAGRDARRLLKVRRDALAKIERLADVQHFAGRVEHAVDARQVRQA